MKRAAFLGFTLFLLAGAMAMAETPAPLPAAPAAPEVTAAPAAPAPDLAPCDGLAGALFVDDACEIRCDGYFEQCLDDCDRAPYTGCYQDCRSARISCYRRCGVF